MAKFVTNLLIFFAPLIILAATVIIVDPYNFFPEVSPVPFKKKEQILADSNQNGAIYYGIWKTIEFKRNPSDHLIVGDSRPFKINTDQVYAHTNVSYYNLAIPASNLDTTCSLFWLATRHIKLKKVYLGIGFQNYNSIQANQMYKEIERCTSSIFTYPLESRALRSTIKVIFNLVNQFIGNESKNKPDRNQQWNNILLWLDGDYARYKYPHNYKRMLTEISLYCKTNKIEFHIIIYPQHKDVRDLISKYSLDEKYKKFVSDMKSIGIVHNLDDNRTYYSDKSLFADPIHPNFEFNKKIVDIIWK